MRCFTREKRNDRKPIVQTSHWGEGWGEGYRQFRAETFLVVTALRQSVCKAL
jgi:hypothetical protein